MPPDTTPSAPSKFCSDCGSPLNPGARFCHNCGSPVQARAAGTSSGPGTPSGPGFPTALRWGVPALAIFALAALSVAQFSARETAADSPVAAALGAEVVRGPDISSMSPAERADRLFNRVMRLSTEGKADSAAFFGPMALSALEALAPLDAHRRYDMGLVALVNGNASMAAAQADTILRQRPTHLLGLALAARAADARGDAVARKDFRRRLVAAEPAERTRALAEYADHDADIRAAVTSARQP